MYRAHYGYSSSPLIRVSDSRHTSALYSFCNLLVSLLSSYQPTHIAAALDTPTTSSFRRAIYPEYKAHRIPTPSVLSWQLRHLPHLCKRMGLSHIACPGYEADDVIASIVSRTADAPGAVTGIVSQDKDFVQLLRPNVSLLRFSSSAAPVAPSGGAVFGAVELSDAAVVVGEAGTLVSRPSTFGLSPFTVDACVERYAIPPSRFIDFLALTGDASDNIPGVPSIGSKTASRLLAQYPTLTALLDAAARGEVAGRPGVELSREGVRSDIERWRTLVTDEGRPGRARAGRHARARVVGRGTAGERLAGSDWWERCTRWSSRRSRRRCGGSGRIS